MGADKGRGGSKFFCAYTLGLVENFVDWFFHCSMFKMSVIVETSSLRSLVPTSICSKGIVAQGKNNNIFLGECHSRWLSWWNSVLSHLPLQPEARSPDVACKAITIFTCCYLPCNQDLRFLGNISSKICR